ncbi:hypothetical protein AB0876_33440 [Mycobacterium sp. NPDC049093]
MSHLAEAYNQAARRLATVADELTNNPNDTNQGAAALRETLTVLEHLGGLEPSQKVRAQLHRLHADFKAAGTITPDKIRETAQACGKVAQNNAQWASQVKNIW